MCFQRWARMKRPIWPKFLLRKSTKAWDQIKATMVPDARFKCRKETDTEQENAKWLRVISNVRQVLLWTSRDTSPAKRRSRHWWYEQETGAKESLALWQHHWQGEVNHRLALLPSMNCFYRWDKLRFEKGKQSKELRQMHGVTDRSNRSRWDDNR